MNRYGRENPLPIDLQTEKLKRESNLSQVLPTYLFEGRVQHVLGQNEIRALLNNQLVRVIGSGGSIHGVTYDDNPRQLTPKDYQHSRFSPVVDTLYDLN